MSMRKPRTVGTANAIQWPTIGSYPSGAGGGAAAGTGGDDSATTTGGNGGGDGGLLFSVGGMAGRLAIGVDYSMECFLLFCGGPWEGRSAVYTGPNCRENIGFGEGFSVAGSFFAPLSLPSLSLPDELPLPLPSPFLTAEAPRATDEPGGPTGETTASNRPACDLPLSALSLSDRPACDLPLSLCLPACDHPLSDRPAYDLPLSLPSLFPTGEPPRRTSGSGSGPNSSVLTLSLYSRLCLPSLSSTANHRVTSEPPRPLWLQIRHRLVQDVAVKVFSMQEYSKELINSLRQEQLGFFPQSMDIVYWRRLY
ncbi:uncharacterized protein LOC120291716 [Eucalyptus grandis]|uniref:uncharacterized protein LOC120291716 n=1 Tax=Eucalyptus grandis TaxID=71139 RepID=UPI00192EBE9F|nr:uncharacterized protein LOC120291716 [Eucalyptus grandis]